MFDTIFSANARSTRPGVWSYASHLTVKQLQELHREGVAKEKARARFVSIYTYKNHVRNSK